MAIVQKAVLAVLLRMIYVDQDYFAKKTTTQQYAKKVCSIYLINSVQFITLIYIFNILAVQSKCKDPDSNQNPELKCVCMQYNYDIDRENGNLGFLEQRAICDDDGFFGPVVCIPGQTYIYFFFCKNK